MRDRRLFWCVAALLFAGGLALRAWGIAAEPLWLDEAYSAYAAGKGFAFLWQVVPRYETHPPFYYTLLRLWTLAFGDGLIALRSLGLVCGVATLPIVAWAARELGLLCGWDADRRRRLALAAFGLACLSPSLVEMARQVRPYPVMILAYAAAIACLLRVARQRRAGRPLADRWFAAYCLLLAAMLWLHNLGPFYAAALVSALGCTLWRTCLTARDRLWLAAGHVMVAAAWVPALAILADQAPAWIGSTWLRFAADRLFLARLAGLYALPGWPALMAILLAGIGLVRLRRGPGGRGAGMMLLTLALLPVLLAVAASLLVAPVFLTRTLRPVAVPAILLMAAGVAGGGRRRWLTLAMAILLGAALAWAGIAARRGPPMQDWAGTVAWLRRHAAPTDLLLAYPNEGALPLAFALRDARLALTVRPVPGPVPSLDAAQGDYPNGTRGVPRLAPARLRAIAADPALARVRTVWLLRLGGWTYDPGDVFLTALRRGRYIVRTWRSGPIEIVGLRSRPAPVRNRR